MAAIRCRRTHHRENGPTGPTRALNASPFPTHIQECVAILFDFRAPAHEQIPAWVGPGFSLAHPAPCRKGIVGSLALLSIFLPPAPAHAQLRPLDVGRFRIAAGAVTHHLDNLSPAAHMESATRCHLGGFDDQPFTIRLSVLYMWSRLVLRRMGAHTLQRRFSADASAWLLGGDS
jgi:hypothetical protein